MATTGPSRVPFIKPGLGTRLGEALRGTAGQDTSWALRAHPRQGAPGATAAQVLAQRLRFHHLTKQRSQGERADFAGSGFKSVLPGTGPISYNTEGRIAL